jgi:CheY-like chemotaxis protein
VRRYLGAIETELMATDDGETGDTADTGERRQSTSNRRSQIRVLHVDDAPDVIEMNRRHLEDHDERMELEVTRSVAEARERLAEDSFDCLVSDYEMPGTNGIEFCETLREENVELPFILYTSTPSDAVATSALSAGVTDYVQKERGTAHLSILANAIVTAVESRRTRQTRNRLLESMAAIEDGLALLDDDGQFTYVDDAYAAHVGTDPDELLGEQLGCIFREGSSHGEELLCDAEETGRVRSSLQTADSSADHVLVRTGHDGLVCVIRQRGTEQRTDE